MKSDGTLMAREQVLSIHLWTSKRLNTAKMARRRQESGSLPEVMLAGKCKAYVDVLCQIENKFKPYFEP